MDMEILLRYIDYVSGYLMLKLSRTIVLSTVVLAVILIVRRIWKLTDKNRSSVSVLYFRTYLWLMLLPVPLMGGLKLSYERFSVRNRLYVALYQLCVTHTFVGKLYFFGMLVVLSVLVFRKVRLRRWVRSLPEYKYEASDVTTPGDVEPYGGCLVPADRCGFPVRVRNVRLSSVRIRVAPLSITPFTTGFFRPVIILPESLLREFDSGEIDTVLQHEYCHIRRGHLLVYGVLDLFRVLWFVNPLVHICAKLVKDDLELICDNAAIRKNTYSPEGYARTLLKSLASMQAAPGRGESHKGVPAWVSETSFQVMKKRMESIAAYREYPKKYFARMYVLAGAVLIVLFCLVKLGSYPAYTPYEDYSLYSSGDGCQLILDDSEELNAAVELRDDGLLVNNRKVRGLLEEIPLYNDTGEYWLYYGGYSKLPGFGGGGDVHYFTAEDLMQNEMFVPFRERDGLDRLLEWILKYL